MTLRRNIRAAFECAVTNRAPGRSPARFSGRAVRSVSNEAVVLAISGERRDRYKRRSSFDDGAAQCSSELPQCEKISEARAPFHHVARGNVPSVVEIAKAG
jgi:hypothetical protein